MNGTEPNDKRNTGDPQNPTSREKLLKDSQGLAVVGVVICGDEDNPVSDIKIDITRWQSRSFVN